MSVPMSMAATVVLYPSPGIGHLISMVELGKLILTRHPSFSITIFTTTTSFNTGSTGPYLRRVSSTTPSITFHNLPLIPLDPASFPSTEAITFELLRLNTPHVRRSLLSLSTTTTIAAFVIDLFCTPALPLGSELNIPSYYFFTSSAGCLDCFLYLPTIHQNINQSFKDLNTDLYFPNLPPIPAADMPSPMLERNSTEYECFIDFFNHMPKSDGIIVNTFEALEPRALKAISAGLCVPNGVTPPVFCIGPLIASGEDRGGGGGDVEECLTGAIEGDCNRVGEEWAEVFVGGAGSTHANPGAFGIARPRFGFVAPGRFLGPDEGEGDGGPVVGPAGGGAAARFGGWVRDSLRVELGVGSRVRWGSDGGVLAWPLYAEQRLNRVLLVKEMKLALWMNESESGFVTAEEVEKRVTELMDSEEGKAVRDRVKAASEGTREAMREGGSSRVALAKLVESWKQS
ncbi:hypothetical protein RHSIM_Rhsim03G0194400 [Rhododendron simsii]|uniref:Uncharacterized protein n=1 Tax=Rhododendron simsii TaxID=118357 RepID=A0A834H522_RHOSS|nr:hypothetical protein RHSIM_Rhsim03G0194400 [Rhododendron simsii]